ncbi:MAG TPA: hypothetical protein VHP33_19390 [Polyangiaceae bacterium]|nr:hypothetical protein [Polyangiaceae bacterium]
MRRTFRFVVSLGIGTLGAPAFAGCGGVSSEADETCVYGDDSYQRGERFPADDGCNTCVCDADGRVSCTLLGCETCEDVVSRYSAAIEQAKQCEPSLDGQCSELLTEGLACGCQTFVNAARSEAIAAASAAQQQYADMSCGGGIVCGPCRTPSGAFCSSEGRCEALFEDGDTACKVNGVVYESGTGGIADPVSCNTCACDDGRLSCTEIGCPVPCPSGTAFGTQCAHCGPTDACAIVEHACLPTCSDACEQGVCIEGVCRTVCG